MYLVDTNVWLEILLQQEKCAEASAFITSAKDLNISDFSLYSIGIILTRLKKAEVLERLLDDLIISGNITVVSIPPQDIKRVSRAAQKFKLDFDDAYQYCIADMYALQLVSYDRDFQNTDKKAIFPSKV